MTKKAAMPARNLDARIMTVTLTQGVFRAEIPLTPQRVEHGGTVTVSVLPIRIFGAIVRIMAAGEVVRVVTFRHVNCRREQRSGTPSPQETGSSCHARKLSRSSDSIEQFVNVRFVLVQPKSEPHSIGAVVDFDSPRFQFLRESSSLASRG